MNRKRGLGRGLDALLGESAADAETTGGDLAEIEISNIHRSRYQPRRDIDEEGINELAASIKAQGLMQPIVLRRRAAGGFEIIAGERRWRAAQVAGLTRVAAVVKDVSDEQAIAMALIENIQREDLNPIDEALALRRLADEFGLTQQQVADAVGKSRVTVTNLLRLLNLAGPVRELLERGAIEMGHARALLSLDALHQIGAAEQITSRGLSVRQAEALVRQLQSGSSRSTTSKRPAKDPDTRLLETRLSDQIGAPVVINADHKGGGQLVIRYSSLEELDGILEHLR